jgi:hypothetical protein
MNDEKFMLGLRVGLYAAMSATDHWDGHIRKRIRWLIEQAESSQARSALTTPAGRPGARKSAAAIAAGSRRAKTPQAVECEASQSGGEAVSPRPEAR